MKCEKEKSIRIIFLLISFTFLPSCSYISCRLPYDFQPIKENTLIETTDFSVKSPSSPEWGVRIERDLSRIMFIRENVRISSYPYTTYSKLTQTSIYVKKNKVPEEKWHLTEQEFTNDFIQEVEPRYDNRKNVNKGQTTIDGKKLFFISYKGEGWYGYLGITAFIGEESIYYIYCPTNFWEKHIFYTFLIEEKYRKEKIPKSYKVDLDQILPIIRSFQVKNITGE